MDTDCTFFVEISQPRARVWEALTSDSDLKAWFDPGAKMVLQDGGSLEASGGTQFRGRFRKGQVIRSQAPAQTVWSFPLGNHASQVTWKLATSEEGTRVTVNHQMPAGAEEIIPPRDGKTALFHFWFQNLVCLKYWCELAIAPHRAEFGATSGPSVNVSMLIPEAPEAVWNRMTQADELDRWLSHSAKVELRPGGKFTFGWDHGAQQIVELVDKKRIRFTWLYNGEESFVTFSVEPKGSGTIATIQHSGLKLVQDYHEGWLTFLHVLNLYVRTKRGLPTWLGAGE